MRILVIRRDNIGDLVCTTPLFAALRVRYPDAHIAALVNSYNAPVLDGNPDLDAVHVYTKLKHRLRGQSALDIIWARFRTLSALRRDSFDYIVLASSGFNRHGLRFARQLRRRGVVGFANGDEPGAGHITIKVPAKPYADLHEVQIMTLLAQAMDVPNAEGPLRIFANRSCMEQWLQRIPELRTARRPWIAVHVSARKPSCRWPVENWIDFIGRLTASGLGVIVVWAPGPGSDPRHPGDDEKAAQIMAPYASNPFIRPAPTSTLVELIAVLALCQGFIGSDGGAMHIAAALGLPILALFDNVPTTKHRWHPWRVPHEVVASANPQIADATVEQLAEAWRRLTSRIQLASSTPEPMLSSARAPGQALPREQN